MVECIYFSLLWGCFYKMITEKKKESSKWGITACCLSLFFPFVSIILAVISLFREKNKKWGITAICLSIMFRVFFTMMFYMRMMS